MNNIMTGIKSVVYYIKYSLNILNIIREEKDDQMLDQNYSYLLDDLKIKADEIINNKPNFNID